MEGSLSPFLVGVDVKVTGNEFVKDHTEYVLLVSCQGKTWRVNRRYRQFDALHQRLRRDAPRVFLPPMPPKQWFGRLNPDFINQRQRDLQRFIDELLANPRITSMHSFRAFLEVDKWVF